MIAATAGYLEARSRGGEWHVRIDDLDPPRTVPGAAAAILGELERLGFEWDGPVVYQSERSEGYEAAITSLGEAGATFYCACTRAESGPGVYPGTCRDGVPPGRARRAGRAVRLRAPEGRSRFIDRVQGPIDLDVPLEIGEFVIRRRDGLTAYHLAAVVDDAALGASELVRGADLLASSAAQAHLRRALGFPAPSHAHVPVATDSSTTKLSKASGAPATANRAPRAVLLDALNFLGQPADAHWEHMTAREIMDHALTHWSLARVPRVRALPLAERG